MLVYSMLMITGVAVAIAWRRADTFNRESAAWGTGLLGVGLTFVICTISGFAFSHHSLDRQTDIDKTQGQYVRLTWGDDGDERAVYKTRGLEKTVSGDYDIYGTLRTPRMERDCTHSDGWVLPFSWDVAEECITNFYIPRPRVVR